MVNFWIFVRTADSVVLVWGDDRLGMKTTHLTSSGLKKVCWAVAFLGAALMMSPLQSKAGDDGWSIALALDLPGKGGWNTCAPYAKELYSRISRAGGEAYLIVFDWTDDHRISDRHAMVVYRDAKGRYWGMDQRLNKPIWLSGRTPSEWASFFSRAAVVEVRTAYTTPANHGQYADLSRAPRAVAYVPCNVNGGVTVASR